MRSALTTILITFAVVSSACGALTLEPTFEPTGDAVTIREPAEGRTLGINTFVRGFADIEQLGDRTIWVSWWLQTTDLPGGAIYLQDQAFITEIPQQSFIEWDASVVTPSLESGLNGSKAEIRILAADRRAATGLRETWESQRQIRISGALPPPLSLEAYPAGSIETLAIRKVSLVSVAVEFSSGEELGPNIEVASGASVLSRITLMALSDVSGMVEITIRRDIANATDETELSCPPVQVDLSVGQSETLECSFEAPQFVGVDFRQWFLNVDLDGEKFYDPNDPFNRPHVQLRAAPSR